LVVLSTTDALAAMAALASELSSVVVPACEWVLENFATAS
jgi:hypothetical protein